MSRLAKANPPILVCCLGLVLVACERDAPRSSGPIAPSARAGSSSEDSSDTGGITTASLTATATVTLTEETGFVVSLEATECAAGGNTIDLTAPVSETLTTDGCSLSPGTSWSFAGPYRAGTEVTFEFTSGFTAAKIRVDGSFPEWTLRFEDGTDDDFDDIVLGVRAERTTCKLVEGEVDDPLLQDPNVLDALSQLARKTNWDEEFSERFEQGGYLVRRNGAIELVPGSTQRRSSCAWLATGETLRSIPSEDLVGVVHTHTARDTVVDNPGTCWQRNPDGSLRRETAEKLGIVPGPSRADVGFTAKMFQKPSYLLDPEKLYRLENTEFGEPVEIEDFELKRGEGACIPG